MLSTIYKGQLHHKYGEVTAWIEVSNIFCFPNNKGQMTNFKNKQIKIVYDIYMIYYLL